MGYLFAAFAVTWAAVFVYVVQLRRAQRRLEDELAVLQRAQAGQG